MLAGIVEFPPGLRNFFVWSYGLCTRTCFSNGIESAVSYALGSLFFFALGDYAILCNTACLFPLCDLTAVAG